VNRAKKGELKIEKLTLMRDLLLYEFPLKKRDRFFFKNPLD
jgi:hypothetical protein